MSVAQRAWDVVMASHSGTKLEWGPTDVDRFLGDPKRIAFFMARYKFAAKMLARCHHIIDVGCGSGMGTLTFLNDTRASSVLGLDSDRHVIAHAVEHLLPAAANVREDIDKLEFVACDFMKSPYVNFSGLCCLDVIEHIDPVESVAFIAQLRATLADNGVAVIGTPSLASAPYASVHSQAGHINLYEPERLREELEYAFRHVFIWGMNDEIPHLGFEKFYNYILALCIK